MGTIKERTRKDGSTAFMAEVKVMRSGKVHREAKTFDKRKAAESWLQAREKDLTSESEFGKTQRVRRTTLAMAIDQFIKDSVTPVRRTKAQVLRAIKTHDIADMPCAEIRSSDIVDFARELGRGRSPQTVANYMSHLAAVFAIARPAWSIDLDPQAMTDALKVSKRLGLTGKSEARERRPDLAELNRLLLLFTKKHRTRPYSAPMHIITVFALFSTRRLEEITLLRREDYDQDGRRILVRDMKDPQRKSGNNMWLDLPEPAARILDAIPDHGPLFFPHDRVAVSAAFTRACQTLEIEDLKLHDLRHEGITRLFEIGNNIPHVAAVSGHRSWASLRRYTHIRQTGDKYKDWIWIERAVTAAERLMPIPQNKPRRLVAHQRPKPSKAQRER
ncbi:MAG: integrase [Polymorphum sp.]|nr:integrase [Polymorphum sp.]